MGHEHAEIVMHGGKGVWNGLKDTEGKSRTQTSQAKSNPGQQRRAMHGAVLYTVDMGILRFS